jgi:hypothetical protein
MRTTGCSEAGWRPARSAYVLKVRAGDDLLPAIRAALRGELLISPSPPVDEPGGRE